VLHERSPPLAPAALHDLVVDLVAVPHPADEIGRQPPLAGHAHGALDRHPRHQPRVREVLAAAARLPDALVRLVPVLADPLDDPAQVLPRLV
jgi:hypothetical protein